MNKEWRHNDPIPETECPKCGKEITYNGNYYCTQCDWALPHPIELIRDQKAYQDALTKICAMQGIRPELEWLESTE